MSRALYDIAVRSVEWNIMRAPTRAYSNLVAHGPGSAVVSALGRPVVVALLIGATMATSATEVADAATVTRATLAWAFVVLTQVAGAAVLLATARHCVVSRARAFDLLFAANGPWSCWLIGFTLWTQVTSPIGRSLHAVPWTLLPAAAWTAWLIYAYCRVVLGDSVRAARWRTGVHQAAMWGVGLAYFFWAVQGWPRLIGWWR
jgi:hypothetical protein